MSLDLASLKAENSRLKEGNAGGGSDFLENFVKFPEGNGVVVVRLLGPAASGLFDREDSPFFQATRTHRVNGKSLHCLKSLEKSGKFTGECPICRYYNWLWQESEKKGPEEAAKLQAQARAIKPIERYYYNCIVRKEVQENGDVLENVGPKILSVGKTLHKMIITGIVGNEELQEKGYGDVTDINNGRDFKIIKTMRQSGKDSFPNYDTSKFVDPSVLGNPDQVKLWLASLHDIVSLRTLKDPEELKIELKKHLGVIPADEVTASGFDPSEYSVGGHADEPVVHQESVVNAVVAAASEAVGDDEFFQNLRSIN